MAKNFNSSALPEHCYAVLPGSGQLIEVRRGEKGYYPCAYSTSDREYILKGLLGVQGQQLQLRHTLQHAQQLLHLCPNALFGQDIQIAGMNEVEGQLSVRRYDAVIFNIIDADELPGRFFPAHADSLHT